MEHKNSLITIVLIKLIILSTTYAQMKQNNLSNNTVINSIATNKTTEKNAAENNVISTEGGKISVQGNLNKKSEPEHTGREHVLPETETKISLNKTSSTTINNKITIERPTSVLNATKTIPVYEKTDDNTKTKPRKGVTFEDFQKSLSSSSTTSSTPKTTNATTNRTINTTAAVNNVTLVKITTQRPKKPTITIGSDDDPVVSSKNKPDTSKAKDVTNIPSLDYITENKKHSTDYVVPIVAVILSVPLVAILISVLYKRGAEWWQHRHYRRMDFLIEGMYNN